MVQLVMKAACLFAAIGLALACGGPASPSSESQSLQPCPTSGPGGVVTTGRCFVFSPASAGASVAGQNATRMNYALEPSSPARGTLVVVLNGSGQSPSLLMIDPNQNLFNAALESGNHVLAVAYRSDVALVTMCSDQPGCYGPSRRTMVTGAFNSGSHSSLADIREDEGIVSRIDQALRTLAAARPQSGWSTFISSATAAAVADRIAWQRIIVSGHSQGGGHAAYIGKMFPVSRVVQFSATCDAASGVPAPWTDANSGWATSPATAFYGFSAPTTFTNGVPTGGDLNCPYHFAIWQNLGMPSSRQDDTATVCAGMDPHPAAIFCNANYARWITLFR